MVFRSCLLSVPVSGGQLGRFVNSGVERRYDAGTMCVLSAYCALSGHVALLGGNDGKGFGRTDAGGGRKESMDLGYNLGYMEEGRSGAAGNIVTECPFNPAHSSPTLLLLELVFVQASFQWRPILFRGGFSKERT